jgi:hypothetical protein
VADSCEHVNEVFSSIQCGEFLDQLSILLTSQEGIKIKFTWYNVAKTISFNLSLSFPFFLQRCRIHCILILMAAYYDHFLGL